MKKLFTLALMFFDKNEKKSYIILRMWDFFCTFAAAMVCEILKHKHMKRFFTLLFVALLSAGTMWANEVTKLDKVPYETYMKNISFDQKTKKITFIDTYQQGTPMARKYTICFASNDPVAVAGSPELEYSIFKDYGNYYFGIVGCNQFKCTANSTATIADSTGRGNLKVTKVAPYGEGGELTFDLSQAIDYCCRIGEGKLRLFISGSRTVGQDKEYRPYEVEENAKRIPEGTFLNNYIDVNFPGICKNNLITNKMYATCGEDYNVMLEIQGSGVLKYNLQILSNAETNSWNTAKAGILTMKESKYGKNLNFVYQFNRDGMPESLMYRAIVEDTISHLKDTSNVLEIPLYYTNTCNGAKGIHHGGDTIRLAKPADCMDYVIKSNSVCKYTEKEGYRYYVMPASNVEINLKKKKYEVRFLDADRTVLKIDSVFCGMDAFAPENPSMEGYTFKKWDKDFTNVHKDLTVMARYKMGDDYYFESAITGHTNSLYPVPGFAATEDRVMVGDSITFMAEVRTPGPATLYYQKATTLKTNGKWNWEDKVFVGDFTAEDASKGQIKEFRITVPVAYDYHNEIAWCDGYSFSFRLESAGTTLYSKIYKLPVYYPITIQSLIPESETVQGDILYEGLLFEDTNGDIYDGVFANGLMPARHKDTIRVYRINGGPGACMGFERVNKPQPQYAVTSGLDKQGVAYFICPGEKETIKVTSGKKVVWFSNTQQTQSYDFSDQGLGKYPHAYYAEVVSCGGSIQKMPEDPVWEGRIFAGWFNNSTDPYADDAYNNVPALESTNLEFEARWIDPEEKALYDVAFYGGLDGQTKLGPEFYQVHEGEAADPPAVPAIAGYSFIKWSGDYSCITSDTAFYALYSKDDTEWTVTYKLDADSVLCEEKVQDGYDALGATPMKAGHTFMGWDQDLRQVHKDITTTALFEPAFYTVQFRVEGVETYSTQIAHGTDVTTIPYPKETPVKESTKTTVYTFREWVPTPDIETVIADVVLDAVFDETPRKYTVLFQDWNHTELFSTEVEYGKTTEQPDDPKRENFKFVGWDIDFSEVYTDLIVTALYEEWPTYHVTLLTEPQNEIVGVMLSEDNIDLDYVLEGTLLHLMAVTYSDEYLFTKWSDGNTESTREVTINSNATFTAVFEKETTVGLDDIQKQESGIQKILLDGQLYILREDKIYTVTGQKIK